MSGKASQMVLSFPRTIPRHFHFWAGGLGSLLLLQGFIKGTNILEVYLRKNAGISFCSQVSVTTVTDLNTEEIQIYCLLFKKIFIFLKDYLFIYF